MYFKYQLLYRKELTFCVCGGGGDNGHNPLLKKEKECI